MRILIMGLPGAGKTTLARLLAPKLSAVWFDADEVRPKLWPELGYSCADRIENSARLAALCAMIEASGHDTLASFICPLEQMRTIFAADHVIWIDRIKAGRFADTNGMFIPPTQWDLRLELGSPEEWLEKCLGCLK